MARNDNSQHHDLGFFAKIIKRGFECAKRLDGYHIEVPESLYLPNELLGRQKYRYRLEHWYRGGVLQYFDAQEQDSFLSTPICLMQDLQKLYQFGVAQAYYIAELAGFAARCRG